MYIYIYIYIYAWEAAQSTRKQRGLCCAQDAVNPKDMAKRQQRLKQVRPNLSRYLGLVNLGMRAILQD